MIIKERRQGLQKASSSVHLTEKKADSKRHAKALQSPPAQNFFIDGRRWLRPPPPLPSDIAASRGGDKMAASRCSVAAVPKMAAPCHVSTMAGSLAEAAMAEGSGPRELSPSSGPPRGCPGAVAGATRVTKFSKTVRSESICTASLPRRRKMKMARLQQ
ncbi:unnamed protein product [Lampetra fluviatilis]